MKHNILKTCAAFALSFGIIASQICSTSVDASNTTFKQQISIDRYQRSIAKVNILTAWRLRQFVFENATLREIVNKLSVKFNVNINIESSALAQRKFRCVINDDEELVDILKLLEYLAPIHYKIEENEVFIYEQFKK